MHHQLNLAAPLIGMIAMVVLVYSLGSIVVTDHAVLGSGVDELAMMAAPQVRAVDAFTTAHALWIAFIALVATAIVSVCAVHRTKHWVESVAFWGGILAVPAAYIVAPNQFGLPLAIIFGCSVIARML
jgi:hypothetical protein